MIPNPKVVDWIKDQFEHAPDWEIKTWLAANLRLAAVNVSVWNDHGGPLDLVLSTSLGGGNWTAESLGTLSAAQQQYVAMEVLPPFYKMKGAKPGGNVLTLRVEGKYDDPTDRPSLTVGYKNLHEYLPLVVEIFDVESAPPSAPASAGFISNLLKPGEGWTLVLGGKGPTSCIDRVELHFMEIEKVNPVPPPR